MKFYNFDEIKSQADCLEIARELGLNPNNQGRCAAVWRGGNNPNVAINKDGWFDHKDKSKGSVIDLVALAKFSGCMQQAQQWLGEYLRLIPRHDTAKAKPRRRTRLTHLIESGYTETKRYDYTDAFGNAIHQVIRLEHVSKKKEFIQCAASGKESLEGIETVLYNLPELSISDWAILVEGEKDADTLTALDMPATTNAGGAGKWQESYTATLAGKDIVIIPDNDAPGEKRAVTLAMTLLPVAKSVKIIRLSKTQKGDVTDWIKNEGGNKEKLLKAIEDAPTLTADALKINNQDAMIADAKEANKYPFRNYRNVEREINGKIKLEKEPRKMHEMIEDIHRRFLNFPRIMGSKMFDHDKDTGVIFEIDKQSTLFSWIWRKSKQRVDWVRGSDFLTKEEFFEALLSESIRYESVSAVPSWPKRNDVYYSHSELPPPSQDHSVFWGLVDLFSPLDEQNRRLIATFVAAPIFFKYSVPKPSWVIDSSAGAGVGKTTLVEMVSTLYGERPLRTTRQELKMDVIKLYKRMLSTQGRNSRVLILDNLIGQFQSSEWSDMVTAWSISGMRAYGRGEETRPNDITYVITANSSSLFNDITDRSFCITLVKPRRTSGWNETAKDYIVNNQFQIFADILDILDSHVPFQGVELSTRFPMFEEHILQAMCQNVDQYKSVLSSLEKVRSESNIEEDQAGEVDDIIRQQLSQMEISPLTQDVFIRSAVLDLWLTDVTSSRRNNVQIVRELAKMGMLKNIDKNVQCFPHRGENRRRGIARLADRNI
ncbi:MAG: hypothetical protein WCT23_09145, partial [Candidatus Neomarinimicrobiota bacterium]